MASLVGAIDSSWGSNLGSCHRSSNEKIILYCLVQGENGWNLGSSPLLQTCEVKMLVPPKIKLGVTMWCSNSAPSYIPKRTESRDSSRYLYTIVHSSTVHDNQKVETTQILIHRWIDKQYVVYPYNGILFSHKKEWSTDITDKLWKHYAKWKKLNTGNSGAVQWLGLSAFTTVDPGSIPGRRTKIPQAVWHSKKKERKKEKS